MVNCYAHAISFILSIFSPSTSDRMAAAESDYAYALRLAGGPVCSM
jgi:hypothetical protein